MHEPWTVKTQKVKQSKVEQSKIHKNLRAAYKRGREREKEGIAQNASVNFSVFLNDFELLSSVYVFDSRPIFSGYKTVSTRSKCLSRFNFSCYFELDSMLTLLKSKVQIIELNLVVITLISAISSWNSHYKSQLKVPKINKE